MDIRGNGSQRFMVRSEKLIELGNSWFSAKTIEVEHFLKKYLRMYSSGYDTFSFIGGLY